MICRKCGADSFLVMPHFEKETIVDVVTPLLQQPTPNFAQGMYGNISQQSVSLAFNQPPTIFIQDAEGDFPQQLISQIVEPPPTTTKTTTICPHINGHHCLPHLMDRINETCGNADCKQIEFFRPSRIYDRFILFYYHLSDLPTAFIIMMYFILTAFAMSNGVVIASIFFVVQYTYFLMNKRFSQNRLFFLVPILTSLVLNYWKPEWYLYFYTISQKTTPNIIIWNVLWLVIKIFGFMHGMKVAWSQTFFDEEKFRLHTNSMLLTNHALGEVGALWVCTAAGLIYYGVHILVWRHEMYHPENILIGAGFCHSLLLFLFKPTKMLNFKMYFKT